MGTLAAGRHGARRAAGLGTRFFQGVVGGAFMALTLSGFSLENPVESAALRSPRVFLGCFFAGFSLLFAYAVADGLLFEPAVGAEKGGP